MSVLKKACAVTVGTVAVLGGLTAAASPASAACAGPVYNPLDPTSFVNVCADARTYDADPSSAGFGVMAAGSASISLFGYSQFCTGYVGAGVNLDFGSTLIVQPDTVLEGPNDCQ